MSVVVNMPEISIPFREGHLKFVTPKSRHWRMNANAATENRKSDSKSNDDDDALGLIDE